MWLSRRLSAQLDGRRLKRDVCVYIVRGTIHIRHRHHPTAARNQNGTAVVVEHHNYKNTSHTHHQGPRQVVQVMKNSSHATRRRLRPAHIQLSFPRVSRSLLVFDRGGNGSGSSDNSRDSRRFRHFDSSEGSNRTPAELTAAKFLKMFNETGASKLSSFSSKALREGPRCS